METPQEELTALYHRWMQAIKEKDTQTLDGILGAEYVYTASGQGKFSREGWMRAVPVYDIESFSFSAIDVRQYGDVAIAIVEYRQEAIYQGTRRSGTFLITDAWVRRDDRWQVVARSSIRMPQ
jgi:ketosteroid isomerase-like protein